MNVVTILVTGAKGQLGKELVKLLDERKLEYISTDRTNLDITSKNQVMTKFEEVSPTVVYHCAAYTAVDKAEDEGRTDNYLVNEIGTKNIAEACQKWGTTMVYISTDYVFDGHNINGEYSESDSVNPINEYGKAKMLGELIVKENLDKYYIIRTSWVFGEFGNNFVYTMKKLAQTHNTLTVVNDQFGRPTWTRSLSEFMLFASSNKIEYGTYHFSNDNHGTWFDFAVEILKDSSVVIEPVDSSSFPQKATRPKYSIMNLDKVKSTGFHIETWQEALSKMLNNF